MYRFLYWILKKKIGADLRPPFCLLSFEITPCARLRTAVQYFDIYGLLDAYDSVNNLHTCIYPAVNRQGVVIIIID